MALLDALPSPLHIRRTLGKQVWGPPKEFPGQRLADVVGVEAEQTGWVFQSLKTAWVDKRWTHASVIVSASLFGADGSPSEDGVLWIHASQTGLTDVPDYADLVLLHRAVFGERFAYQVFAPSDQHVNINERACHLWGRADGKRLTPAAQEINGRLSV